MARSWHIRPKSSKLAQSSAILPPSSVGLALGVAYVVGILLQGLAAWLVSAFLTTVVYVTSVGLELAVAHRISRSDE